MTNRLAQETSPYLQQHADNPVNWYPWGKAALQLAREQNKPILLSIGYSACHWCHVMAHESFEDTEVAAIMNQHFINIKVDREERPDLDHIYQSAHYLLTQRNGGWPLTLFLTPDQTPFVAGTYFPKQARHNVPGFAMVLERVTEFYRTHQEDIATQNTTLRQALDSILPDPTSPVSFSNAPLDAACNALQQIFDPIHGGFGSAPKFPHPTDMEFLFRYAARNNDSNARHMALYTLRKMADGGINDQLGGGFCRYSVDAQWKIPHFEKMLYDNGLLLALYTDAYILTGEAAFKQTAHGIANWVIREMQALQGGYYSSLDADSEHEEGKFYVWTPKQVASLLSVEEYAIAAAHYGLELTPNFEYKHWNLIVALPLTTIAENRQLPLQQVEQQLSSARQKLLAARANRIRPGRDEKILVSWNALMIKAMAHAGRILNEPSWVASAQQAVDFIHAQMWQNGRLLATAKDGKVHLNAYLDDYAFLLDALLELMQAEFRLADLKFARAIAEVLLDQFEDKQAGGFFFTSHDHEQLIHRPKPGHDNAMPAGNGIAAFALQRFGFLLGEVRYLNAAERTLALYYPALAQRPGGFSSLLMALQEHLTPPQIIILRSAPGQSEAWRHQLFQHYAPEKLILALEGELAELPAALAKPLSQQVSAWICQGTQCWPPLDNCQELLDSCF